MRGRQHQLIRRSRMESRQEPTCNPGYKLLLQKHIIRRIGRREHGANLVAGTLELAALGVDSLNRGYAGERTGAARLHRFKFEPRDILRGRAVGAGDQLADNPAAVFMLPGWSGVMPSDGLAVLDQSRDRLTELPSELAAVTSLAIIDLCALGMHR